MSKVKSYQRCSGCVAWTGADGNPAIAKQQDGRVARQGQFSIRGEQVPQSFTAEVAEVAEVRAEWMDGSDFAFVTCCLCLFGLLAGPLCQWIPAGPVACLANSNVGSSSKMIITSNSFEVPFVL